MSTLQIVLEEDSSVFAKQLDIGIHLRSHNSTLAGNKIATYPGNNQSDLDYRTIMEIYKKQCYDVQSFQLAPSDSITLSKIAHSGRLYAGQAQIILTGLANLLFEPVLEDTPDNHPQFTEGSIDTNVGISKPIPLEIYPNPVGGGRLLNVHYFGASQHIDLYMLTVSGQISKTLRIPPGTTRVDLSEYPEGVYFLKANDTNSSVVRKIILQ